MYPENIYSFHQSILSSIDSFLLLSGVIVKCFHFASFLLNILLSGFQSCTQDYSSRSPSFLPSFLPSFGTKCDGSIMSLFQGDKCRPCPESWIQHGEKCYHFSKEMKTWHKKNKEELDFIKSQASFHWIGLSRTAIGHSWVWQDGTPRNVKIQEPGEKCALFKAGEAFSHNCTGQYRYICEKRATQKKATERAQGRLQYPWQS
uniref:C-type lectin domain-containing protein n=1 Tax=Chrysemys picta bellii TaxID=8478 RepID=A0A8C3P7E5_CHRPI